MLAQFGNNWIKKIPLTAKLDLAYGLRLPLFADMNSLEAPELNPEELS